MPEFDCIQFIEKAAKIGLFKIFTKNCLINFYFVFLNIQIVAFVKNQIKFLRNIVFMLMLSYQSVSIVYKLRLFTIFDLYNLDILLNFVVSG